MLTTFIKGLWIGGTLSVPGVSGGTMAMLIGIYEPLLHAVNSLISKGEEKKEKLRFLFLFSIGGILGFVVISTLILNLMSVAALPMIFFFSGAVAGGIPLIYREIKQENFSWINLCFILFGGIIVLFISALPKDLFQIGFINDVGGVLKQFICGIIVALALILPGISVSHMLYVLGIYENVLNAVSSFNWLQLLPFVVGISLGILAFARMVDICFIKYRSASYSIILGFVFASVLQLLSASRNGGFSLICIPLFLVGFCIIYLISKKESVA